MRLDSNSKSFEVMSSLTFAFKIWCQIQFELTRQILREKLMTELQFD